MSRYLRATHRAPIADLADSRVNTLRPDQDAPYDEVIEINLSELEPHINGPFTPDISTPVSTFPETANKNVIYGNARGFVNECIGMAIRT